VRGFRIRDGAGSVRSAGRYFARYVRAMSDGRAESLAEMVQSYLDDDDVSLLPDDPVTEARRNTWCYSVSAVSVDVPQVVAALNFVAAALRRRFAAHGSGTFYAWYDLQAGQLRCSLSSRPPESLPFGAPYFATGDPVEVVRLAALDPSPGVVLWSELVDVTDEAPDADMLDEQPAPAFPVWCAVLP
jgi:hypothetical protein